VKAASKTRRKKLNSFEFKTRRKESGKTQPYEPGLAFAFVATTCTDRFYLVSAEKAEELKIVGKDAPSQITLPHPNQCEADHPYHPFLFPPRA
jgi:hypothetical protein